MTPEDFQAFNSAVAMAQKGDKTAYQQLEKLYKKYPADPNLLLWLVYTAPAPSVAGQHLDKLKKIDPNNIATLEVEQWLLQQTSLPYGRKQFSWGILYIAAASFLITTAILGYAAISLFFEVQDFKANAVEITAPAVSYRQTYRRKVSDFSNPIVQFRDQTGRLHIVALPVQIYGEQKIGVNYTFLYHRNDPKRVKTDNFSGDSSTLWIFGSSATVFGLAGAGLLAGAIVGTRQRRQTLAYQPPAPSS